MAFDKSMYNMHPVTLAYYLSLFIHMTLGMSGNHINSGKEMKNKQDLLVY